MSTRSMIYQNVGGKYKGIYCHCDGYIEYNGILLYMFYDTEEKVSELINLGSLSVLGARIGNEVEFNRRYVDREYYNSTRGQCVAYHRDRGEKLEIVSTTRNKLYYESYNYVFEKGQWWLIEDDKFLLLEKDILSVFKNIKQAELKNRMSAIMRDLTDSEKKIFNTKLKKLMQEKEAIEADYVVMEKKGDDYKVMDMKTKKIIQMKYNELWELLQVRNKVVERKWGNSTRKFYLD